jgi:arylsulfatase A-like enzyme
VVVVALVALATAGAGVAALRVSTEPIPSFAAQLCGVPREWLERTQLGYHQPRSGQVTLLPKQPIYMSTGSLGWTHSGPWSYLQHIPIVFYGPGRIPSGIDVDDTVTTADVAPTLGAMLGMDLDADGNVLRDVVDPSIKPPKVIVTVVWDGGGYNGLETWPDAWPTLKRLMSQGVSYTHAEVGSSPSVTPAIHTTLGTGYFPDTHGITGVPVRDEQGTVVDSFNDGKSAGFMEVPTLAETWDEMNHNRALIGMVGYEPWHLGMIGRGAEAAGGDKDDAVWVNRGSNHWVTNRSHYSIPATFRDQSDMPERLQELDLADGDDDDRWKRVPLDEQTRIEETPAFIAHHGQKLVDLIGDGGYGADSVPDLLYTNFKQIDRVAHYYNMTAPEVRDVMVATDEQLGVIVDELEREVGHGNYVLVVTADHGMQPDVDDLASFAIDPNEVERDIVTAFGPVVRAVWPTEVFLLDDEMSRRGITVDDVARFLQDYRLRDNTNDLATKVMGLGRQSGNVRLFEFAAPAAMLETIEC